MSFLRKFFRSPSDSQQREELPTAAPEPTMDDSTAEQPSDRPSEAVDDTPQVQSPPDQTDDTWWQESRPLDATPESDAPPAEVDATPGTAPLEMPESESDPVPANEPAEAEIEAPSDSDTPPETPAANDDDSTRQLIDSAAPTVAALRSKQGLAAAALRDVGRVRSANQDSVYALITTLPREGNDLPVGLFIVADGMGGHDAGDVASRMTISAVAHQVMAELILPALSDGSIEALQPMIISAVQEANRSIFEYAQSVGSDMGTTCTAVLLVGHALYIGHVGDSRAYLRTPTGLQCLTTDHSAVGRLIQLGQIQPDEAREHPLRSQLYRTVGQTPEVQVDFVYQQVEDATHLLLCSDGLWGMIEEELILDVLDHTIWPQDACRELIARANLAGGEDNISAVVVTLPLAGSS